MKPQASELACGFGACGQGRGRTADLPLFRRAELCSWVFAEVRFRCVCVARERRRTLANIGELQRGLQLTFGWRDNICQRRRWCCAGMRLV
jgi:hypothetical protein